jgi:hypothetical protein
VFRHVCLSPSEVSLILQGSSQECQSCPGQRKALRRSGQTCRPWCQQSVHREWTHRDVRRIPSWNRWHRPMNLALQIYERFWQSAGTVGLIEDILLSWTACLMVFWKRKDDVEITAKTGLVAMRDDVASV